MAGRSGRKKYMTDEDFEEGDVWGVMEGRENSSSRSSFKPMMMIKEFSPVSSCPRMILRSSSSSSIHEASMKQFSAPLDIPDWSKIYGKGSKKKGMTPSSSSSLSTSWVDVIHDDDHDEGYDDADDDDHRDVNDGDGDDDDDDDGMVPPHEYIARKLARSQISSFSVCEGMGRTLKGRDLRKVRNAVLTRTGFLE